MRFDPPRPNSDDERILPLINVVFLLLIFFMLTGQLSAIDPIEVTPPVSASEGAVEARELVVVLGAGGQLALDDAVIDEEALKAALAERMEANPAAQVWLKADGAADSTDVIALMETLREVGVERLKLLTVPAASDGAG
ncbi:ExbD/TolR family protein [Pelagibius sp.]|uniref:ExbD/TolR family protein n=1 Tax=Pelagibius sp. TaxID=1931238 RepID=UPI003BB01BF9